MRPHLIRLHSLRSNLAGYQQLAQIYREASQCETPTVVLSGARLNWLDANMSAPLAAVQRQLRIKHGREIKFQYVLKNVETALRDVGFFSGGVPRKSMARLRHFQAGQSKLFAVYSESALTGKGLPRMTVGVSSGFFQGIHEIFQNFEIHSRSDLGLYACGQLYPRKSRLIFTLADMGIGIPEVVNRALGQSMRASSAINWAMSGRNTTRQLDVPGGLGLKMLRQFIELNRGALSVVSGGGYWSASPDGLQRYELPDSFPGTIVTIEVDTADTKSYQLADDIDPDEVF